LVHITTADCIFSLRSLNTAEYTYRFKTNCSVRSCKNKCFSLE